MATNVRRGGTYVPPSMRAGKGAGAAMESDRDPATLRVTNGRGPMSQVTGLNTTNGYRS